MAHGSQESAFCLVRLDRRITSLFQFLFMLIASSYVGENSDVFCFFRIFGRCKNSAVNLHIQVLIVTRDNLSREHRDLPSFHYPEQHLLDCPRIHLLVDIKDGHIAQLGFRVAQHIRCHLVGVVDLEPSVENDNRAAGTIENRFKALFLSNLRPEHFDPQSRQCANREKHPQTNQNAARERSPTFDQMHIVRADNHKFEVTTFVRARHARNLNPAGDLWRDRRQRIQRGILKLNSDGRISFAENQIPSVLTIFNPHGTSLDNDPSVGPELFSRTFN